MGGLRFGVDGDGNYGYYGADGSLVPFKSKTPFVDVRNLTSNTSNEYFDFSVSAEAYANVANVDNFYKAINGEGLSVHNQFGWYAGRDVTVTIKLKKHIPNSFMLEIKGGTNTSAAISVPKVVSYTNVEMKSVNDTTKTYVFSPTCKVGESFSLVLNSGYQWSSFYDFHIMAF